MNKIEKILGANIAICDGSDCCESEEVGVLIFADLPEGMTRKQWLTLIRTYLMIGVMAEHEKLDTTRLNTEAENAKLARDYNISIIEVEWQDEAALNAELPKWTC